MHLCEIVAGVMNLNDMLKTYNALDKLLSDVGNAKIYRI